MTLKFRLYYNDDGTPKFYSMEELEGNFIYIDHQTFMAGRHDITVINGKIKSLSENIISKYHLVTESSKTTIMCDSEDITLLTDSTESYKLWDYTYSN
jgi:hypothetical protein